MAKWIWEGMLSMDIPEDWQVREDRGTIEIEPALPGGAVHVSVLRRDLPAKVQSGEAARLIIDFAREQGVTAPEITERAQNDEHVAESHFETADEERSYAWDVYTKVWPKRAIVLSLCHDGNDRTLQQRARRIFNSAEGLS